MTTQKLTQAEIDAKFGRRYEAGDRVNIQHTNGWVTGTVVSGRNMRGVEIRLDNGHTVFRLPNRIRFV
jgi:hypothetical protein